MLRNYSDQCETLVGRVENVHAWINRQRIGTLWEREKKKEENLLQNITLRAFIRNNRTLRVACAVVQNSIEGTNSMIRLCSLLFFPHTFICISDLKWSTFVSVSILMHGDCCCCRRRQRYGTSLNYCCTCSANRSFVKLYIQQMHTRYSVVVLPCRSPLSASIYDCVHVLAAPCIWIIMRTNCST